MSYEVNKNNEKVKEKSEDALLEKAILFLSILVGGIIIFNQFQFLKMPSNILLNSVSLLLILALIGLIVWLLSSSGLSKLRHAHKQHHAKEHQLSEERGEESKEHGAGSHEHGMKADKTISSPLSLYEKLSIGLVAIISILIIFNQFQISQANTMLSGSSSPVSSLMKSFYSPLKSGAEKGGVVIGPQLNTDGKTTKLVEWPTISDTPAPKDTGNPTQDAISSVVPTGTPFYASEGQAEAGAERIKGVSFDDPLTSQKVWASLLGSKRFGTANTIQLNPEEEQRWKRLTSVFTCDFCCGGPNSVTTIARCGCAHSYAWQGMAKFFIKYHPDYSDEQILGEMTKWKALWYPQGMIQDYLVYTGQHPASILTHGGSIGIKQQFLQQGANAQQHQTQASVTPLEDLPSMVGGC